MGSHPYENRSLAPRKHDVVEKREEPNDVQIGLLVVLEELGASENRNRVVSKLHQWKFEDGRLPAKSKFLHDTLPIEFQHALTLTKQNFNELKKIQVKKMSDGLDLRSVTYVHLKASRVSTLFSSQQQSRSTQVHKSD